MLQFASPISVSSSVPAPAQSNLKDLANLKELASLKELANLKELAFAEIETPRTRLCLVRSGISRHWPSSYLYAFCGDTPDGDEGWLWEVVEPHGNALGFIGLAPARCVGGPRGIFGPILAVMLKREVAPRLGAEAISGLMTWLSGNHICHVVHAGHAEDDGQLARWLDASGFLYTGCRDDDGGRSMILIL